MRAIGEAKGKQDLFTRQAPGVLETLRSVAEVQSIESSNRIEGVVAPRSACRRWRRRRRRRSRSEQEIAGYRDVLATIHANARTITLTPGVVLQFHRDLFAYLPGSAGAWKSTDNDIVDVLSDGSSQVRLTLCRLICSRASARTDNPRPRRDTRRGGRRPLVLIAAYRARFPCIHPFLDGNGRMARLLRCSSSISLVTRSAALSALSAYRGFSETYYESLLRSSQGWHEGAHDLSPWLEYFFGVLLAAYKELESRVGGITQRRGYKRQMVIDCVGRLPDEFAVADVERACPGIPRPTVNRVLGQLRDSGLLESPSRGRDAIWKKTKK